MGERNLNFDLVIPRKDTRSLKYDFAEKRGMPKDILPLWVADMDFQTSSYIQDALIGQVNHGIFGYSEATDTYFEAVRKWVKKHYEWDVDQSWLIKTPGIVFALSLAVKAFTQEGEGVLIQQPVYYPFAEIISDNKRKLVINNLYLGDDLLYHVDFEDFEQKIISDKVKIFILCNPHNPVGRVWTIEELTRMGDICLKHQVLVLSDEIHADFIFAGKHQVFANIKKEYEEISITCHSPSKTFNLAGLQASNIWIINQNLRRKFRKEFRASGYSQLNVLGLIAAEVAYQDGEEWYQGLMKYLKDNITYVTEYLEKNLPQVKPIKHQGTYLLWLDFRGLGLSTDELNHQIIQKAKLWLDGGEMFGEAGAGFQRINVACPRSNLEQAMERLRAVL